MNFTLLIVYSVALLLLLLLYQKRKKTFDAGSLSILIFVICSVASVLSYTPHYSYNSFLFPLIYLFVTLYLSFKPICKFDFNKTVIVFPKQKIIEYISWFFVICTIIGASISSNNVIEGIQRVIIDESYGLDTYNHMLDKVLSSGSGISNLPIIIMNAMYCIAVLLLFILLTYDRKKIVLIILVSLSILYGAVKYLSIGERGGIVNRALIIIASYICIKNYLTESIRKKIRWIGFMAALLIFIPFIALTNSRFRETETGSVNSIYNYAGQGTINFCKYALNDNGIRYGDRTIPLFKRMLFIPNVPKNFLERRDKYPYLKINDEVFSTFIGDFAIDFGPIFAFLLILFNSVALSSLIGKYKYRIRFHYFLLFHFYLCVVVQGPSLFQFADTGNLAIIMYFLFYLYFKYAKTYPTMNEIKTINNNI